MRPLSLAQVLEVHRKSGRPIMSLQPRAGEFDVAAYDVRTGKRLWREVKKNIVTWVLNEYMQDHDVLPGYVFLTSDTKPTHPLKTVYRSTWNETGGQVTPVWDIDTVSRLWTLTGTVLAPAAGKTRTFQTVGCAATQGTVQGNSWSIPRVWAATKLSSQRVQDDTQQVVISYRLAWEEGSNV